MLVFIDESGCAGFKFGKGSTPYFIIAMVIFDEPQAATSASEAIDELRSRTGHRPEFRFSKTRMQVKDEFFSELINHDFTVRALVVNKQVLHSKGLRGQKRLFYNYFVQMLMHHDNGVLQEANVQIDGSGDRVFKNELGTYLRQQVGPGKLKKFRFADSKRNNLIQLADMCAGAIARSYNGRERQNADRWLNMLKPKIGDLWNFPY